MGNGEIRSSWQRRAPSNLFRQSDNAHAWTHPSRCEEFVANWWPFSRLACKRLHSTIAELTDLYQQILVCLFFFSKWVTESRPQKNPWKKGSPLFSSLPSPLFFFRSFLIYFSSFWVPSAFRHTIPQGEAPIYDDSSSFVSSWSNEL